MRGQLFLLAVVCVSFVQVRGDEKLDKKIQEAIREVEAALSDPYVESYNYERLVGDTLRNFKYRSVQDLAKAAEHQLVMEQFLRQMASFMKGETQKPDQSVFSCIDNICDTFTQKVRNATKFLRSSLAAEQILMQIQGAQLYSEADAVTTVTSYQRSTFESRIKNCTTVFEVGRSVEYFKSCVVMIKKSLQTGNKEFHSLVRTYTEKVEQFHNDYSKEMENLKTDSVCEMTKCQHLKAAILGKSAFLQLISSH